MIVSMENWFYYGGSLDRFDKNNWCRCGLYEDLFNVGKCWILEVCEICVLVFNVCVSFKI